MSGISTKSSSLKSARGRALAVVKGGGGTGEQM
jgi:hypothetical protein